MNTPPVDDNNVIKSVDASLTIVETLTNDGPMTITELAEKLDRSPSNVLAHLRTLQRRGFVVEEDAHYRPGLRYNEIGNAMKTNYPLYVYGTEPADDLGVETGEYVWLMVAEQERGYYLYKTGGEDAVESGAYTTGSRWHLNATASGKVVPCEHGRDATRRSVELSWARRDDSKLDYRPGGTEIGVGDHS